jgi:hypothetical protein
VKKYHVVRINFHMRSKRAKDPGWFDRRFMIFESWTLRSLKAQIIPFMIWICCEPGMQKLMDPLKERHPEFIFTFGGHYMNALSPNHRRNLRFSDVVCLTRIDSDDVYRCDALKIIDSAIPIKVTKPIAVMFRQGYLYEMGTGRLAIYSNPSPPFYSIIFPTNSFMSKDKFDKNFCGDHSMVKGFYETQMLPPFKFCILIHKENWTSTFESFKSEETINPDFSLGGFIEGRCG